MSEGAFSGGRAAWLAAAAGTSLAAAGLLGAYGDAWFEPPTAGADAFSRSALGHRAFLDLLRDLGYPVVISRHATDLRASDGAAVALLEPELEADAEGPRPAILEGVDEAASRLLVVLPKRTGLPDAVRPRWIQESRLRPQADAQRILDRLRLEAKVVRPDRSIGGWRGALPAPALEQPQLLESSALAPILAADEGILVGEWVDEEEDRRIVVVADPDLLATHGLGRGDNAVVAVMLAERLGVGEVPLVVDETLHGLSQQPSLVRELLRFPLVLVVLQALAAGLLAAWAALVRFGRARPAPRPLAPGKAFLIENTAALLRHGGHVGEVLHAYLRAARDEVLARSRPPPGTPPERWLGRFEAARGREGALAALEARVRALGGRRRAEAEALRAALDVHRWREELTDGAHGDPGRDR